MPAGRQGPSLAYDRSRRTLVMYGGVLDPNSTMDHQTWTMDVIDLPRPPATAYLRGSTNPSTLFLSSAPPATAIAKYSDSSGIRFAGGNAWTAIGTWTADPVLASGLVTTLKPLQTWIGLKNSDDQGTRFDLRAEVFKNGAPIGAGEARCIEGVTRNADLAKAVSVAFTPISPVSFNGSTDVLSVRILTRIGTDTGGSFCGGHSSAVGLRLYYDSTQRNSNLGF
ncbi:MAG: hypothetical protein Q8N47_16495 [Bryobacterales bacterium]|nr:hypothetical protein [Bryobacterales bacterium]